MNRDRFKCKLCKDETSTLHVHHLKYEDDLPWMIDDKYLVTLCEHCHESVEYFKKYMMKNIPIDKQVKCYKSTNWTSGAEILFVSMTDGWLLRIYEGGKLLKSFEFDGIWDAKNIIHLLKFCFK